jgi:hypothetical protein
MMREREMTEDSLDLRVDVGDDITVQEKIQSTPDEVRQGVTLKNRIFKDHDRDNKVINHQDHCAD